MPVEKGVLSMVVQHLPSPNVAQKNRVGVICPLLLDAKLNELHANDE
jgi:hypothetical protein